jgi:hypothetical protein
MRDVHLKAAVTQLIHIVTQLIHIVTINHFMSSEKTPATRIPDPV